MKVGYQSKIAVLTTSLLTATFLFLTLLFLVPQVEANQTATVTGTTVNIRSGPATTFSIVTQVNKGAKLDVLKESNGWYNVRTASGRVGWVAGWLVSVQNIPTQSTNQVTSNQFAVVNVATANVRSGPGLNFARVIYGYQGDRFEIIGQQGEWYKIRLKDGRQAWISSTVVRVEKVATQPSQPSASQDKVTVTGTTVNIRSGPGTNFAIVASVVKGNVLNVIGKSGDWYNVRLLNGKTGWIAGWLVQLQQAQVQQPQQPSQPQPQQPIQPEQPSQQESGAQEPPKNSEPSVPSEEKTTKLVIQGASAVNIRTGPSTGHSIITTLPQGTALTGLRQTGDWYNVRLLDGREGWIFAIYVREEVKEEIPAPATRSGEKPLIGKVIVIDPGHGNLNQWGVNPGAVGLNGLTELEVNLDIALKLRDILTGLGAKVIMTHTGTTTLTLSGRADVANRNNADIFVSIHANANTNRNIKGTSTFYYAPSTMNQTQRNLRAKLAQAIQNDLVKELKTRDIGILQEPFTVIKETSMPSVLVETAFISNPEEEALLATESFRLRSAQAIARGIVQYFN